MAEFAYNNIKNASIGHISFELNCGYHPPVFYKKDINPRSMSKSAEKLLTKPRKLMTVYWKNLYYTQKLQKRAHDKAMKPKSYISSDKVLLNNKYIKIKWNCKLEAKFFGLF